MALMRDVLARFAVLVDDKPLSKLDRKIEKVKQNLATFGRYAGVGFAAAGVAAYKLVEAASDAAESLNVLRETFGANTDAVLTWSKTVGKAMGRSQYSLQRYAGDFGAFLEPQFRDTDQDISKMSMRLSELAIDLASFYNTSDEEAKMRLFSGLSGETEAVRRLGVDISDTSLSAFNHERGDSRNVAQLTLQEKTLLRYEKILRDTNKKQGDAIRTAKEWANSLRRLRDMLKDMAVRLGKLLIGPATKMLGWAEQLTKLVEGLTFKTSAWQAALATVAGVYATKGLQWLYLHKDLVKWTDLLNKQFWLMNARVLAITAAFLILEDLFTLMRGGKSVFGDFITIMTGIQRPLDLVNAAMERMAMLANNFYVSMRDAAQIAFLIPKVMSALAVGDIAGAKQAVADAASFGDGWISQTKAEADGATRQQRLDSAALAGDKAAYVTAMEGSGRSDEEIDSMWLRDRQFALQGVIKPGKGDQGRAQANDLDMGSGLVEAPKFATVSHDQRQRLYGGIDAKTGKSLPLGKATPGGKAVTININGGDEARVRRIVREALVEDDRAYAAEVAELGDPELGDN